MIEQQRSEMQYQLFEGEYDEFYMTRQGENTTFFVNLGRFGKG